MKVDLEQLAATAEPIRAKVCVVGAGIAGLLLAQRLAARGIDVALLEAGGDELEARSQTIYDATMAGALHTGTHEGRFRTLGGSSTRWGGQLLPYTPDIFQPPGDVKSRTWPISGEELRAYEADVQRVMGVDDLPFEGAGFLQARGRDASAWSSAELLLRFSKWAPFSKRNLANTVAKELAGEGRVTIYLHANVTELLLRGDGIRIAAVLARNYAGARFRFEAEHYVLAAGTIETSRLLLASRSVAEAGVGNDFDQVGRYFHDHLSVAAATLQGTARARLLEVFAPYLINGTTHSAKLEASAELRERLGLLAVMAHITIEEPEDSGAGVAKAMLQALQRGDVKAAVQKQLPKLPGASLDLAKLAYAAKFKRRRYVSARSAVVLRIDAEQVPDAGTRVRLDESAVDALGMPRTLVDWRISAAETATLRGFAGWLREYLRPFGDIDFRSAFFDESDELMGITDTYHAMGGTRMGTDPLTSVVDTDLKMHGVENFSVASAAVYPAGGSSNPTFTLMCLALRLADHLAAKL